jgi:hypothetical protein
LQSSLISETAESGWWVAVFSGFEAPEISSPSSTALTSCPSLNTAWN